MPDGWSIFFCAYSLAYVTYSIVESALNINRANDNLESHDVFWRVMHRVYSSGTWNPQVLGCRRQVPAGLSAGQVRSA